MKYVYHRYMIRYFLKLTKNVVLTKSKMVFNIYVQSRIYIHYNSWVLLKGMQNKIFK